MNNSDLKVAFIRNRIYTGGIFQVMLEMIKVLNSQGIIPDLVTMKSKVSEKIAKKKYNMDVKFSVREILHDFRIPYEWHIVVFNMIAGKYLSDYDLVINHNNTSFLYTRPEHQKLISYVHFPRKARNLSGVLSIHKPKGDKKRWYHIRRDPFNIASVAYRFDNFIDEKEQFLANSNYTRNIISEYYDINPDMIRVLYPPVRFSTTTQGPKFDKNLVVSLGRFSQEKRQLFQLKIARSLPDLTFFIVGFLSDINYFQKCKNYIDLHNLKNVTLLPDLDFDEIEEHLNRAGYFLHSVINEPFGITTVKAISHGCIPIVPNSGGQLEIVPIPELRYDKRDEAVNKLKKLSGTDKNQLDKYLKKLQQHIQLFDARSFRNQFQFIVNKMINP